MLKRSFSISSSRLNIQLPQGTLGGLDRLRSTLINKGQQKDTQQERPSASSNRFRAFHERNGQHNRNSRGSQFQGDQGKGYSSRNGNRGTRRIETNRPVFDFSTGSERAQEALKNLIMKVKEKSSNYYVNYVDPATKKFLTVSLASLVNKLDLKKEGIRVLPPQGEGYPIIRVIPVTEMMQAYVDELAEIKQKELLDMGSSRAIRAAAMRAQAEKKKSATKILTLSWSISVSDLLNQKKNEIEKRLKKDDKLVVFVGEKGSLSGARMNVEKEDAFVKQLNSSNTNWERMDEEENLLEMKKREMIFAKLQEMLHDLGCKMDISGNLDTRMMIKISSQGKHTNDTASDETQLSAKELKRLKKLEKAKERAKAKEKKLAEEDIDSLYSLKIED
ncbi:hypothetical protein JCM33374_g2810 [Metschnikowia sp. JCM 33374]|nr:hypothetical protein JCM33374_g2810 [Metschnikowia sp. JCM 33374]